MKQEPAILADWKAYFNDRHEGLGTTYERFVLNNYFRRLKERFGVCSVLEVPLFGMTGLSGINSMWWAVNGAEVAVLDNDRERACLIDRLWQESSLKARIVCQEDLSHRLPFDDKAFDLGWNFASLWFVRDLGPFLKELTRVSRKAVFICVPNNRNVFNWGRLRALRSDHRLVIDNIDPFRIRESFKSLGWAALEEGYLDCPPWPDIAMKKEEMLKRIGLSILVKQRDPQDRGLCILDYFSGKNRNMEKEVLRHGWLERMPDILKRFWAHHRYFVFVPEGGPS